MLDYIATHCSQATARAGVIALVVRLACHHAVWERAVPFTVAFLLHLSMDYVFVSLSRPSEQVYPVWTAFAM